MPFTLLKPNGIDLSQTFAFTGTVSGAGGGKVNQVIEGDVTTSTTITSTTYADVNLEATITPSNSNSKILVLVNLNGMKINSSSGGTAQMRIVHDQGGSSFTNVAEYEDILAYNDNDVNNLSPMVLHTPSNTNAHKYKIQVAQLNGFGSGSMRVNNRSADGGYIRSSIILMEILA